jgi:plastocyanin
MEERPMPQTIEGKELFTQLIYRITTLCAALAVLVFCLPRSVRAQQVWKLNVGAESKDHAKQGDAFLPNEVWIYEGDSIQWTFIPQNEIHTVTFLTPGSPAQTRPPFTNGCTPFPPPAAPGYTASGSSFDGSTCLSSPPLSGGATYKVTFPTAGNYKLVCLVHADMNGTVHVMSRDSQSPFYAPSLPYHQWDYDQQARDQANDLIRDSDNPQEERHDFPRTFNEVIMTGEVAATGGGRQYLSIVRFIPGTIRIHVGDTVEWTNADPTEPHTVTFGTEPSSSQATAGVTKDADGAWHATISTAPNAMCGAILCDTVSSGFLQAASQDRINLPQSPVGTTRLRITFTHAGTYNYICALHDVDGMKGTVIVEGSGGDDDDDAH